MKIKTSRIKNSQNYKVEKGIIQLDNRQKTVY